MEDKAQCYSRASQSLWLVLDFFFKFITRVLYMSFVSYFMLFPIANMSQVISLSLLLVNLIVFFGMLSDTS